jgi:hypothetical protein
MKAVQTANLKCFCRSEVRVDLNLPQRSYNNNIFCAAGSSPTPRADTRRKMAAASASARLHVVTPWSELIVDVPSEGEIFRAFCASQGITKPENVKRAADPRQPKKFAESFQGAHNARFLQRVVMSTQQPVLLPPDGLVLITDEPKFFYDRVVSRRGDMSDLHGTGGTPHQALSKLMAGKPWRNFEWRVLKPTWAELIAWLRVVPLYTLVPGALNASPAVQVRCTARRTWCKRGYTRVLVAPCAVLSARTHARHEPCTHQLCTLCAHTCLC